jgi:hypothetical protein
MAINSFDDMTVMSQLVQQRCRDLFIDKELMVTG